MRLGHSTDLLIPHVTLLTRLQITQSYQSNWVSPKLSISSNLIRISDIGYLKNSTAYLASCPLTLANRVDRGTSTVQPSKNVSVLQAVRVGADLIRRGRM